MPEFGPELSNSFDVLMEDRPRTHFTLVFTLSFLKSCGNAMENLFKERQLPTHVM